MPGMRFEPNLSMLFTELPLLERPAAAAAAGFKAAELWWPFDGPEPPGAQVDELADAFAAAGIDLACLNLYGGDFSTGERGLTSVPGSEAVFRANLDPAMELVGRLRCRTINALFGNRDPESTPARQAGLAIENLALAAAAAARFGAQLVVEALNPVEYPRYGLNQSADVIAFLDRARAAGVEARCSFDLYHVVMGGEDPVAIVARHADRIGHVQVADVPGRHEPGTGTVDFRPILEAIEGAGYAGWVGFEYLPSMPSRASLERALEQVTQGAALRLTRMRGTTRSLTRPGLPPDEDATRSCRAPRPGCGSSRAGRPTCRQPSPAPRSTPYSIVETRKAATNPAVVARPVYRWLRPKASGAISSAIIVRSAPAAKAWTMAPVDGSVAFTSA